METRKPLYKANFHCQKAAHPGKIEMILNIKGLKMKFLKCLLLIISISVFAMEISKISFDEDSNGNAGAMPAQISQPSTPEETPRILMGERGPVNYFLFRYKDNQGRKELRWYNEGEKYWKTRKDLPFGKEIKLEESPREIKNQYIRAQTKYYSDQL